MTDWLPETRNELRAFLADHFPGAENLDDTESLLDSGLVDSVGILELVTFIEDHFGVIVTDDDLLGDNFESISSLAVMVCGKRGREGEAPAA